jgi:transcriptional regulator with XRE-family HTH domain
MIGSAMRLRAFRRENGMTQEEAASYFVVDTRTLRRWEAGGPVPAEVQRRIAENNPLTERMVQGLVAIVRHSEGFMLLLDDELVVIENSAPHKARMQELFGFDIVGRKWDDFITPEAREWIKAEGGVPAMIARGFIHCAVPFRRVVQTLTGETELAGVTYQSSVWIGTGTLLSIITIAHLRAGEVLPPGPVVSYLGDAS